MTPNKNHNLRRSEFEIFLMLYAAHVDYVYTQEEEEYIKSISNIDDYNKMLELFNDTNDYACLKIILHNKEEHFDNIKDREYYFNLLKKIFEVDGNYSRLEKSFINFFEKIIEIQKI